jgi:hypothetical protein
MFQQEAPHEDTIPANNAECFQRCLEMALGTVVIWFLGK